MSYVLLSNVTNVHFMQQVRVSAIQTLGRNLANVRKDVKVEKQLICSL